MKDLITSVLPIVLLCTNAFASPSQDQDTAVIDKFISAQAIKEDGDENADVRKVVKGDLNRDGVADLAVLYAIEGQRGGNTSSQYLAVFVRTKGALVPVTHTIVGGKYDRAFELQFIQNNVIFFTTFSYGPMDAACCPTRKGKTRFALIKGKLKELRNVRK